MRRKCKLFSILIIITSSVLLASIPAFADNLPCFSNGNSPRSALTNRALYTPDVTSITVSWQAKLGDTGIIRYQDANRLYLPSSIIEMPERTGTATVTPPAGAAYNTLILGTGSSYGDRYIWYDSITYSDGTTETYPIPYQIKTTQN